MKLLRVLTGILFLCHLAVHAQTTITATATPAACVGDGIIDITITNVTAPITYAVAKLPYDETKVIRSVNPHITNLETGDYYYGYYDGTTFIKAATPINIKSTYVETPLLIDSFYGRNYLYCGTDQNPLGKVFVGASGGNAPYVATLLNASDGSEIQNITVMSSAITGEFAGVLPGTYKLKITDRCNTTVYSLTTVNIAPNEILTDFSLSSPFLGASIIYNTPDDICSGIKSASVDSRRITASITSGIINNNKYFWGEPAFIYKVEIQNGALWDVYDNLTRIADSYPLPSDRSKWGLVRYTATFCGISKTVTLDYGASNLEKTTPFRWGSFIFSDDPAAYTGCNAGTGKVQMRTSAQGGCRPYTLEVTDHAANSKTTSIVGQDNWPLFDIGKTYSFKLTDKTGAEVADYSFSNWTSNSITPKPSLGGPNNIFIDPFYFSPEDPNVRNSVVFYKSTSTQNFGKSALVMKAPEGARGLLGKVTVSLISGPSPLAFEKVSGYIGTYRLGNNLTPGAYKIRVQDSGCFDEIFDVVLSDYLTSAEITNVSYTPSLVTCERYIKKVDVKVSYVGNGTINDECLRAYGTSYIYPGIIKGPVYGLSYNAGYNANYLRGGTYSFTFPEQVSGNYEIGLSKTSIGNRFLTASDLFENTKTASLDVLSNFPSFDLSQSGGIVCSGKTTGDLYAKVDKVDATALYFIKKETDADYPATGQATAVFKDLPAGNYEVKVKTACYEVVQPLILRFPPSPLIAGGKTSYCKGENLRLGINPMGPLQWIKWTIPNGTVYNTTNLALDNLTVADSGTYKVEMTSLGGCYFTGSTNITVYDPQTPTGPASQEFCKSENAKVSNLVTAETGVTWYDAATDGTVVPSTTVLENNKIYYGSLKTGTCESPARFAVTVKVNDPKTPTGEENQQFCQGNNPKVSDLRTTESGVIWYDSNGNIVAPTTALENKIYWGALKVGTCESQRLRVNVNISNSQTPTGSAGQEFCKVNNPKISDLVTKEGIFKQLNPLTGKMESVVRWYDAATVGNELTPDTALKNGTVYYGVSRIYSGSPNNWLACDSPVRFAVTVTISDPKTPTGATTQEFCKVDNKTIADLATNESDVTWYDAADGTTVVPLTTVLENNKVYYGSLKVGTCESPTRLAVTVTLSDPQTPTTAHTTQEFCKIDNKTVADLATNESDVTWYDAADGTTVVPLTTVLENNKVYYGSLKVGTCESPTRLAVTVTLSDPQTPTGSTTQEFCKVDNKTIADLATTESGVTWYDAAKEGNAILPTTVLENNKVYYGSLKAGTCESPTRLAVTVKLHDPQTPTGATTQEFCKVDNKTIADLKTTETGVMWYDDATGINAISSTTLLENNKTYYGTLKEGSCESPTRLAVTVTLSDPQTPTGAATQEFCKVDNKTVTDLKTAESGVTWYDDATGVNAIPSTTLLENNKVYYGSLKAGTCESPTRLAVTVTLSDPKTPTGATTQEFCKVDNNTVADLVTIEKDVTWYDTATKGNVIPVTTALANGTTYYGSLKAGTCESPVRLAVTVTLNDPKVPTGISGQMFCKENNPTVGDLKTNETGVTWYDKPDSFIGRMALPATQALENNKIYYGTLKLGICESRSLPVTVEIVDAPIAPTGDSNQQFCKANNNYVSDLVTSEKNNVTWYDAATAGNVIPGNTVLENNKTYYAASRALRLISCESTTRLAVTVTINDPQTPTGATAQEFCKVDNKTVADLKTTESGVTWYDDASGVNVIPSTTLLENNKVYYGSLKVGTCESPTRLAVTVTLSDPQTPTGATTQEFCKVDNKTVADLATTESGVTWYDDATGINAISSTAFLENNKVYYGSLKVGTCESPTRLAVTVTLSDPQTPTGATTQEFCKVDNKTVA
ncbi:hypothetical protein GJU43_22025, partial [Flavobacterium sp. LC2016-23]|nr:hypothetical protein [Flavobacterium sp. LC2016-23]